MRCLVTGATGFVGSNLVRSLLAAGHEVLATGAPGSTTRYLDGLDLEVRLVDLLDPDQLPSLVKGRDWVFHVAGDTSTWNRLAGRRRRVNVDAAALLADASVTAGVSRFVHTGTVDVHGYNRDGGPLPERAGERSLCGIGYDYADTKAEGEAAVRARIADGLDVVVVYPGFMIGPYDHTLQLGRIIRQMQAGETVFAPPGTASFCDVREVAEGMVTAALRGRTGHGYNLTGHNRSYHDVFTRIAEIVGARKRPIRLPAPVLRGYGALAELASRVTNKPPEMDSGLAKYLSAPQSSDWSKARDELGYRPGDVDRAIRDAAAWYNTHMPTGR
ncbi:NAD-dependent epimerase/dehydratase family protein [Actinocorallia sp. API 0066]|uniref:NAD-dependent epimerase/dehydratase family protein n=1 Tax=Actinocorallia sp. API 0066 TaxID=2896846 RepID=UPI001E4E702F|nr:NAD-dependent epimerase/dehydratase family protein [Actinocorallia sp. API 0066]MCD0453041.1 NAD-dependent epimerase/dehydratase family protein [Actinocorallia sp. API 0066]